MNEPSYDSELIDVLRQGDNDFRSLELIIENDNPVWSMLIRYGPAIRVKDVGGQYQVAHRVSSISRGDERMELRLGPGMHLLKWKDHTFDVIIKSEESREEARVFMKSHAAYDAFNDFIRYSREYSRRKGGSEKNKLVVKVMKSSGWKVVSSYPKRPVDSLITGDNTVRDMLNDMQSFVKSEDDYVRFGLPFKRNYLIVGPPGSGKSSLLTIAASELNLDLCFISVTSGMCEGELCAAVGALTDNSMLVLEDVDVLCGMANSGNSGAQNALAVLTNVLDGTLHRHKLITVLTSANPGGLESVLTRHGRIDHTSRLKPLTEHQVAEMVNYTFGDQEGKKELAQRMWGYISRLGDISSTVAAHFLFKHRMKPPRDIDDSTCSSLSEGTHTEHIKDAKRTHTSSIYM